MKIDKNDISYKLIEDSAEYVRTCLAAGYRVVQAYKVSPVLARVATAEELINSVYGISGSILALIFTAILLH